MLDIRPDSELRNNFSEIEYRLDEADEYAEANSERSSHDSVFRKVREKLAGN